MAKEKTEKKPPGVILIGHAGTNTNFYREQLKSEVSEVKVVSKLPSEKPFETTGVTILAGSDFNIIGIVILHEAPMDPMLIIQEWRQHFKEQPIMVITDQKFPMLSGIEYSDVLKLESIRGWLSAKR